ncbi:transposase [Mucilaginibacter sp.]
MLSAEIASITCDGHKAPLKAIRKVCPDVPVQRCLVHIKRQRQIWLTQYLKAPVTQELLYLSKRITYLKTYEQSNDWLADLYHWYERSKTYVNEKAVQHTGAFSFIYKKPTSLSLYAPEHLKDYLR